MKFWCWSMDPKDAQEVEQDSARDAAQTWVEDRWYDEEQPEEMRVHVRDEQGAVQVFDVYAELDVSFYTMAVDGLADPAAATGGAR